MVREVVKKKDSGPEVPPQTRNETAGDHTLASNSRVSTAELERTICEVCNLSIPGEWVVQCDDCDLFFHYKCVGFKEANKDDAWSCLECTGEMLSSTTTRPNQANRNPKEQMQRTSSLVNEATNFSRERRSSVRADFQAQSLSLRQEFEQRFEDLLTSYQSRERPDRVQSMTLPAGNGQVNSKSNEKIDSTAKTQPRQQVRSLTTTSVASTASTVSPNVRSNRQHSSKDTRDDVSIKSTETRYQSVSSQDRQIQEPNSSKTKVTSSASKVSQSSSQRLRDIEFQRLQEEFEVQTRMDNERLALEREALELKELRQRKLIEGKYRAMEEIVTIRSGSSVNTRAETRKQHSQDSTQSKLVESWILEQRNQYYRPETTSDVNPDFVSETLGVDLSVPVNKREFNTLVRQSAFEEYRKSRGEMNLGYSYETSATERNKQKFGRLTSVTPAYHCNPDDQPDEIHNRGASATQFTSGQIDNDRQKRRLENVISSGEPLNDIRGRNSQPLSNNRISWDPSNQRPNQQSTRINPSTSQQSNLLKDPAQNRSNEGGNQITLTASQIAARHSMPKDLPNFYGHPQDWPQFIKRYYNTTSLCGFSDSENLERLNKCLKDKAHDIVKSLLIMPECVTEIIDTLREKFGRPELIARATLAEVRAEPPIRHDKLEALSDFGYKVRNACNVIESMGLHYYLYSPELIQDVIKKLPNHVKIDWAKYADTIQSNNQQVNLRTVAEWLHQLARTLNQVTTLDLDSMKSDQKTDRKPDKVKNGYLNVHETKPTASEGKQEHPKCPSCLSNCNNVGECSKFRSLSADEKWKCVTENNLCRKCLKKHGKKNCTAKKFPCGFNGCELKHNLLLHNEERHSLYRKDKLTNDNQKLNSTPGKGNLNEIQRPNPSSITPKPSNTHQVIDEAELFRIVPVKIKYEGRAVKTFAFLDEGSSYTLMEKSIANELKAEGTTETICLLWTSGIHRQEETSKVNLEISGVEKGDSTYQLRSVNVVEDLGLSPQSVDPESLANRFAYLRGLPLPKYCNAVPTILIGMKHIRLSTPLETIEGKDNQPMASRSRLGWSVYGPTGGSQTLNYANHHKVMKCPCSDRDDDLHNIVKEHFTIENFGVSINSTNMESKENQKALEMLKQFTVRKGDRFETRLLWKNDAYSLPDSYGMARKRLSCVENKGAEVVRIINEIIEDYLAKGYASKLSPADLEKRHDRTFYLPIFTVTNPKKPGKIRPVFDAAASVNGVSLNSTLLTGPDLLSSLVDILRRFREHQIAVVGDIKEMFYRVWINDVDRHSQRFLWRNGDRTREPDVYQFNVMTFGSKCSPSSAQFVKNTNASEYEIEYPRAAMSIIDNHYVDDMLDGARSVEEAIKLINDVKFVHSQAGFEIRNFKSNSKEVLSAIGETVDSNKVDLVDGNADVERVLGMFWETTTDCFRFSLKYTKIQPDILNGNKMPTKRQLLSLVMSLYDPLGLISYYVIHAKCLLQDVWKTKIRWDEVLPDHLEEKWKRWIELLPQVERLQIPRWYSKKLATETTNELHIFVDAGEDAFAALVYIRIADDDSVECSLVSSKAKVAPIKYLSVPRKELMAAVLGSRLVNSVENGLSLKITRRVIWSDSITVLTWLHSEHKRYSQFVAHRVGEILENTNLYEWRWVPTKLNVADEATKWIKKPTFDASDRWFTGPQFLLQPESEWPAPKLITPNSTTEEMKVSHSHSKIVIPTIVDASKFSSWQRLVRAVGNAKRISAWMVAKLRKMPRPSLNLSQEDLVDSERRLIRQAQWESYTEEMAILHRNQSTEPKGNKSIDKGSSIVGCSPYIDEFGLMRVQGRIDSATAVTEDAKRPIILPKSNAITKLIVYHYHTKFKHQNHETVINELRQRFYIPQIRTVLKSVRWNCAMCKLRRCKPMAPQMADLPKVRFEAGIRPFTYTGLDYFGPFSVKVGRQSHKRWGIIYTCLTIRAIWIDVVPSYDTQACILSIRDFVNRKGTVERFYSDNGTNLKGADNELTREIQKIDFQRLSDEFTSCYTKWYFTPPETPHMGGMWERLITSVKASLFESMITRTPTDQMLRSWLIEAENIVNSRPLTYVPLESEEDEALTPNHFILGSSNGMKPPGMFKTDGQYLRDQWKEVQRCTDIFWKKFIHEYIPTLVRRTKWFDKVKPLEVGDIVINFDKEAPRNTYKRGRIVETIIGTNQQVRRAKVQFANGKTLWRSAHHLGLLDVKAAPTQEVGLDHPTDDKNRGENVGAANSNGFSKTVTTDVARSVQSAQNE